MRIALLLFISIIASCSKYQSDEIWTATHDMPAFVQPDDVTRNPIFTIKAGDKCTPLDEVMAKVYLYTKVRCSGGEGWVADHHFEKEKASDQ